MTVMTTAAVEAATSARTPTPEEIAVVSMKLADAEIPGAGIEFDPDEAELAGAFVEDAMSEDDALAAEDGDSTLSIPATNAGIFTLPTK